MVKPPINGASIAENEDDSIKRWDKEYRMWRSRKAELEFKEADGLLVDKSRVVQEQLRRETAFVREVRRLPFILPSRLHNQPLEDWPVIIDRACSECLSIIVDKLDKVWNSGTKSKKKTDKVGLISTKRNYRKKPGPRGKAS